MEKRSQESGVGIQGECQAGRQMGSAPFRTERGRWADGDRLGIKFSIALLFVAAICLLPTAHLATWQPAHLATALAAPPANVQPRPTGVIVDTPTIAIVGATATTTATPTSTAHEAQIQWSFGTVSGTYSGCTVQLKTSFDGTNWLTLGSAASVTVTSNALNVWTVIEQLGTTSVTTTTPSSSAAVGFGELTEAVFSCSSYGTSAPVAISVIYR